MSKFFTGRRGKESELHGRRPQRAEQPSEKERQPADQVEQVNLERRRILQGILGIGGLAALAGLNEACVIYEDNTKKFTNNFDYYQYDQFDQGDLRMANSRDKIRMKAEDCRLAFQKTMDQYLPFRIDINDFFRLEDRGNEGQIILICQIGDEQTRQALLGKYPFIRSIERMESGAYRHNYHCITDLGVFTLSSSASRLILHEYSSETTLGLFYDNTGFDWQSGPEYSEFLRTISIYSRDDQGRPFSKKLFCETDGGMLEYSSRAPQVFSAKNSRQREINETESFLEFLRRAKSTVLISTFLENLQEQNYLFREEHGGRPPEPLESLFSLRNIKNISQLLEIFRLLPADPQILEWFLDSSLCYRQNDRTSADAYRDPVTTLSSTWADCDDYAVIQYFWAYLHGWQPHMTVIAIDENPVRHVLVWYRNEKNELVVLDNGKAEIMEAGSEIDAYLTKHWSGGKNAGYTIEYNAPV